MNIRTSGLKGRDHEITLGPLTVLSGPNGSGKSSVADALRIAALGFVPHLGRRLQDTGVLLRERGLDVTLELGDGRVISRSLKTTGKGYTMNASASWLPAGATGEEHAVAILRLFGLEELDAAECLDIRQLLQATPQQRAGRLMGLLEAAMRGQDVARSLIRRTVQRLADIDDERMPADYRTLEPLVPREYALLKALAPTVQARLKEVGLQGLLVWVNGEKREAANALAPKRQAKRELAERLEAVPDVDADYLAGLEGRRSQLEREIGAAKQRTFTAVRKQQIHAKATKERDAAAADVRRLEQAHEEIQAELPGLLPDLHAQLSQAETELAAIQPPEPSGPGDEATEHDAAIARLDAEIAAIVIPEPPEDVPGRIEQEINGLERQLEQSGESPWGAVVAVAAELDDVITDRRVAARVRERVGVAAARLRELASAHGANPLTDTALRARLDDARERIKAACVAYDEAAGARDALIDRREELIAQRDLHAVKRTSLLQTRDREYAAAVAAYHDRLRLWQSQRDVAAERIQRIERRSETVATSLQHAQERLRVAESHLVDLGAAPEPVEAHVELEAQLGQVRDEIGTILRTQAARKELGALVEEIAALELRQTVCAALEWAGQRVREDEIQHAGGELIGVMHRMLLAAGRSEAPYIRAGKGMVELGWRTSAGCEVSCQALSGGEWVLYAACLTASVILLRDAPVRVLLVEAAEADDRTLGELLAAIAAVAERLTAAVVMTCHEAPTAAADGWEVVELGRPRRAERAA